MKRRERRSAGVEERRFEHRVDHAKRRGLPSLRSPLPLRRAKHSRGIFSPKPVQGSILNEVRTCEIPAQIIYGIHCIPISPQVFETELARFQRFRTLSATERDHGLVLEIPTFDPHDRVFLCPIWGPHFSRPLPESPPE